MSDNEHQNKHDRAADSAASHAAHLVDHRRDHARCEPQGQQAGIRQDVAQIPRDVVKAVEAKGILYFLACMPMAIIGYWSALKQSRASIACIGLIAKRPDQLGKAIIFPAMVETYAILALLVSILAVTGIAGLPV